MTIKFDFNDTLQVCLPPTSPGPPPCSNPEVKGRDLDVVVEAEVKLESR